MIFQIYNNSNFRNGEQMFCCVTYGENYDIYTRKCIYHSNWNIEPGYTVVVPVKDATKLALVYKTFTNIPIDIQVDENKIKDIISINDEYVESHTVRNYLLAMIDEYKARNINKEEFYCVMENFVDFNKLNINDDSILESTIRSNIPDICSFYIDEPGDADMKGLGFWEGLKDIEYMLRHGY